MVICRHRLHQILFEIATITRIVCVSLVLLHQKWYEGTWCLIAAMLTFVSVILLAVSFGLHWFKSTRNNIAPLVYIILLGITALFGIGESILYGISGFTPKNKDGNPLLDISGKQVLIEILIAAMGYAIVSSMFSISLATTMIFLPPVAEENNNEAVPVQSASNRLKSSRKSGENSKKSRKSTRSVSVKNEARGNKRSIRL